MATYTEYFDIYGGIIGGPTDEGTEAILELPKNYASFTSCYLIFTFDTSGFNTIDYCSVVVYKNSSRYTSGQISIDMLDGWGEIRINLSGGTFKGGDTIRVTFTGPTDSLNGWDLEDVLFGSTNAVVANPIIPGVPSNALKKADTGYPLYYNGYVAVTNASQLNGTTVYIHEDDWRNYYESRYWGDTSKGDVSVGGTMFAKAVLSTSQNLNANPRTVIYQSGCSYRVPGKVYITTA